MGVMGHAVHGDLYGNRNLTLDFFCGVTWPLAYDLNPGVRDVGVGLNGEVLKVNSSGDRENSGKEQDDQGAF